MGNSTGSQQGIVGKMTETLSATAAMFSTTPGVDKGLLHKAVLYATLDSLMAGAPFGIMYVVLAALVGNGSGAELAWWALALVACGAVQAFASVRSHVFAGEFSFGLGRSLRLELGEHLRKIPLGELQSGHTGNRVEALQLDVSSIENTFVYIFGKFVACIVIALAMGLGLLFVNAWLGLLLVSTLPLAFFYLFCVYKKIDQCSDAMLQARRDATGRVLEYINGIKTIRAFNMGGTSFSVLDTSLRNLSRQSVRLEAGVLPLVEIFSAIITLGMVLLILFGVKEYTAGAISLPVLLLFLVASLKFYQPVTGIVGYFSLLRYISRSAMHIKSILDIPVQTSITPDKAAANQGKTSPKPDQVSAKSGQVSVAQEMTKAKTVSTSPLQTKMAPAQTGISDTPQQPVFSKAPLEVRFDNVHFTYPDRTAMNLTGMDSATGLCQPQAEVAPEIDIKSRDLRESRGIRGISFTVPAGKTLALTGPSGSGKSTLVSLLARFWEVDSGHIYVGGQDTAAMQPETLLAQMAFVMQDVHFFNETVAENLRFAKPDATDDELMEAVRFAQCIDVIEQLPQGLNTPLGDGGARLSGGERRRLSVARAMLKDAPIIVLDEATASLDPENEFRMQQAFEHLSRNKTLLVVAHRLSTIMHAEEIIFIEHGSIREQGTHTTLLEQNGRFAAFWKLQQQAGGWKIQR